MARSLASAALDVLGSAMIEMRARQMLAMRGVG